MYDVCKNVGKNIKFDRFLQFCYACEKLKFFILLYISVSHVRLRDYV